MKQGWYGASRVKLPIHAGRAVTFQSNRASEVSNGPRPGVVLRWAHEPRRHAHADASRSGIHTGSEECAMSAWSHSEWRLLHAYVPACSGPARAPLSGKRNFKTRDEGTEAVSLKRMPLKWNLDERQRQSAPSPLVGEGWGGGS